MDVWIQKKGKKEKRIKPNVAVLTVARTSTSPYPDYTPRVEQRNLDSNLRQIGRL
jgi:hypothetical protein